MLIEEMPHKKDGVLDWDKLKKEERFEVIHVAGHTLEDILKEYTTDRHISADTRKHAYQLLKDMGFGDSEFIPINYGLSEENLPLMAKICYWIGDLSITIGYKFEAMFSFLSRHSFQLGYDIQIFWENIAERFRKDK